MAKVEVGYTVTLTLTLEEAEELCKTLGEASTSAGVYNTLADALDVDGDDADEDTSLWPW